jgi:hypothetical protein
MTAAWHTDRAQVSPSLATHLRATCTVSAASSSSTLCCEPTDCSGNSWERRLHVHTNMAVGKHTHQCAQADNPTATQSSFIFASATALCSRLKLQSNVSHHWPNLSSYQYGLGQATLLLQRAWAPSTQQRLMLSHGRMPGTASGAAELMEPWRPATETCCEDCTRQQSAAYRSSAA